MAERGPLEQLQAASPDYTWADKPGNREVETSFLHLGTLTLHTAPGIEVQAGTRCWCLSGEQSGKSVFEASA